MELQSKKWFHVMKYGATATLLVSTLSFNSVVNAASSEDREQFAPKTKHSDSNSR